MANGMGTSGTGFLRGYGQDNPYYSLYNYGIPTDLQAPGTGMMPGMTKASPSYGSPQSTSYSPPGLAADKGWGSLSALDKMSAIGTGVQAFATLAGLYSGWKGLQYQKDQFKFMKSSWNKNFAASLGAYDNALRDNYYKMAQGNSFWGNPTPSEEDWMASRSLSHLGT